MAGQIKLFVKISALIFTIITISSGQFAKASDTTYTLDNGMTVILKESHGSQMVTSMVFVRSGSKYESEYENGITHFLEHLLFDGTANQTREELDRSIRDLGGYINAFTRPDMTAYLVLLPKQYIDYGMTVQVDMLFNSLIPEEELPKERKVVIEEINRDKDSPGYAAEKFFTEKAYANTRFNRPVLGYEAFISNIPRSAIVDYWRTFYTHNIPENIVVMIIGDFEIEAMKQQVADIFGAVSLPMHPSYMISHATLVDVDAISGDIVGKAVYDTVANLKSTYINFSIKAPLHTDDDFMNMDLLSQYLSLTDISPLKKALQGGENPLAEEVSVGLSAYERFSRLEISIITSQADKADEIVTTVEQVLKSMSSHNADDEALSGIKISTVTDFIYNSEKLHYLGFMIAGDLMTKGWEFVKAYPDKLSAIKWADCQTAAAKWLDSPAYIATVVRPAGEDATPYTPFEMASEDVTAYFDTAFFPTYDSSWMVPLTYPTTDSVSFELVDKAEYHSETFDNGMTLIIKSRPESRVFGLNIIGKNRTANETKRKAGITDFVNRCIKKGTVTRNAAELSRDLAKIGANVTLFDNPWIPYDDRYTTRSFSFMKFETIDDYAEKGFHLFADMILTPSFNEDVVGAVRRSTMGVLGRNSGSPSKIAKQLFYETLFEGKELAKPIMGSEATIPFISVDDLKAHHRKYYAPNNMIMSITTNLPVATVRSWVEQRFGRLQAEEAEYMTPTPPEPIMEIKSAHLELDKEQIGIFIGSSLPGVNSPDATAIRVAASILSSRLYLNLREKQGLAYSVGAGIRFDNDFGWYYSTIGTKSENYKKAVDGILLQIDKLKLDGPTEAELKQAKNNLWGRLMSTKLSSINQAYYLGLNSFYGRGIDYDRKFIEELTQIDLEAMRRIYAQYFPTDNYIITTAGKLPPK